jgi:uncharacterized membrane protein
MPYKTMITVAAAIPLVFALAFTAMPKFFVLGTFPGAEGLALEVGIYYRYVMAVMIFMVACITFQTRNVADVDNQKAILLGVGAAFTVMCVTIISLPSFHGTPLNVPPMIATGTAAVLIFWSRSKLS